MAPEILIMILFAMVLFSGEGIRSHSKDFFFGIAAVILILAWGGFFNDTWEIIHAGFEAIFG